MSPFTVRIATPEDVLSLEGSPHVASWAVQELLDAPEGFRGVVGATRGKIVAFWGFRVLPMIVCGDELHFGVCAGSFVEPEYRTGGLHSAFVDMDELFAAENEGRGAGKLAGVVGRFAESDWWTLRRARGFDPVRTETDLFLADATRVAIGPTSERAISTDAARCATWDAPLLAGDVSPKRDGRMMAARLAGFGETARLLRVERDGKIVACSLTVDAAADAGRPPRRDVVDWCVPEGDESAAAALLRASLEGATGSAAFPVFSRSAWAPMLQRAGFRTRAATWGGLSEPYLAVRKSHPRCDADYLAEHWHATAADVCRYPLAALLAPEDSVTPAPPGTRRADERHA